MSLRHGGVNNSHNIALHVIIATTCARLKYGLRFTLPLLVLPLFHAIIIINIYHIYALFLLCHTSRYYYIEDIRSRIIIYIAIVTLLLRLRAPNIIAATHYFHYRIFMPRCHYGYWPFSLIFMIHNTLNIMPGHVECRHICRRHIIIII